MSTVNEYWNYVLRNILDYWNDYVNEYFGILFGLSLLMLEYYLEYYFSILYNYATGNIFYLLGKKTKKKNLF